MLFIKFVFKTGPERTAAGEILVGKKQMYDGWMLDGGNMGDDGM